MTTKIVAMIGCIGAGKDFTANTLKNSLDSDVKIVKFADTLNKVVAVLLGITDMELFQDREYKDKKQFLITGETKLVSVRDIQKRIGTDILRKYYNSDVWVDAFRNTYENSKEILIVTDVRFKNELKYLRNEGALIVYIRNNEAVIAQRKNETRDNRHIPHESERLMWMFEGKHYTPDFVYHNNWDSSCEQKDSLNFNLFLSVVQKHLESYAI